MNFENFLRKLGLVTLKEYDSVVYQNGMLEAEYDKLLDEHSQLRKQIPEKNPSEEYWNNRRPEINQVYLRHETDGDYYIDVRNFFTPHDSTIPTVSGQTNDEIALNSLKWVIKNIKYVSDKISYGFDEFWAYSYQTLRRNAGDCEDGAILLANIMLRSGIPYWRIRLVAGSVNGGGHCYVTYCRETDNQFCVLDWCYWPNEFSIKDRKLHKDEQNYSNKEKNYGIWFSWNQLYCFGEELTMVGMPDYLPKFISPSKLVNFYYRVV
jgi:hypothetical protein